MADLWLRVMSFYVAADNHWEVSCVELRWTSCQEFLTISPSKRSIARDLDSARIFMDDQLDLLRDHKVTTLGAAIRLRTR
jgi:hypothetical protein